VSAETLRAGGDVAIAAFLVAASAFSASMRIESELRGVHYIQERVSTISGVATCFPQQTANGGRLTLRKLDGHRPGPSVMRDARVLVKRRGGLPSVCPGDTLTVTGILRSPRARRNPGGFSEADLLYRKGTTEVLTVPAFLTPVVRRVRPPKNFLASHVAPVRHWVSRVVARYVKGEEGAILLALLLGERGEVPWETRRAFRDSGIVHLLAVSGLHTALVGLVALVFLRGLRLSTRASTVGSVVAVWFYCGVSGFHPSTLRASAMVSCYAASKLLGRKSGLISPLCTSCVVLILVNPKYVWDPGFQLSYAATFFIVAAGPFKESLRNRLRMSERAWKYVVSPALTTCIAQLGVLPVLAHHFGSVSSIAIPTNLLAVPLMSGALVSALCSLGVCALIPQLASVPFALSWLLLRATTLVANLTSSVPGASLGLERAGGLETVAFFVCLTLFLRCGPPRSGIVSSCCEERKKRDRWTRALQVVLSGLGVCWLSATFVGFVPSGTRASEKCLRVSFLDVGQGDAAVIQLADETILLIDGGEAEEKWDNAERVLIPFLRHTGKKTFDIALVTHFHSDHAGGILRLLERRRVREVLVTPSDTLTELSRSCRALAAKKNISLRTVSRPDTILKRDGVELVVCHPTGPASIDTSSASLNDSSVVVALKSGRFQFLFTGDVGASTMNALADFVRPDVVTVLKAPHHGSRLSLSERFSREVHPDYVVFSVGKNNRFGHPSHSVVSAFREHGARVHRTDRDGCVDFTISGDSLIVSTAQSAGGAGRFNKTRAWRTDRRLRFFALVSWVVALLEE
jgi:competence protein ComEC